MTEFQKRAWFANNSIVVETWFEDKLVRMVTYQNFIAASIERNGHLTIWAEDASNENFTSQDVFQKVTFRLGAVTAGKYFVAIYGNKIEFLRVDAIKQIIVKRESVSCVMPTGLCHVYVHPDHDEHNPLQSLNLTLSFVMAFMSAPNQSPSIQAFDPTAAVELRFAN